MLQLKTLARQIKIVTLYKIQFSIFTVQICIFYYLLVCYFFFSYIEFIQTLSQDFIAVFMNSVNIAVANSTSYLY